MTTLPDSPLVCNDLTLRIEHQIDCKTPGLVRFLEVEYLDGKVLIHGQCHSQYAKQLVQEVTLESLDSRYQLVNDILVR